MPIDNRDFRVNISLTFTPANEGVARGLYNHAVGQMGKAFNVHVNNIPEEVSFVSLERNGHRLGLPCGEIERQEVP